MDTIHDQFNNAVKHVLMLAKQCCVNHIPDSVSFIKCYDNHGHTNTDTLLHTVFSNAIANNELYDSDAIINDLLSLQSNGVSISWVDLTLFYISDNYSYIFVQLWLNESSDNANIKYHISVIMPSIDAPQAGFDVNDYYKFMTQKSSIKLQIP